MFSIACIRRECLPVLLRAAPPLPRQRHTPGWFPKCKTIQMKMIFKLKIFLQPAPGDTGKPCGIDYEMKVRLFRKMREIHNWQLELLMQIAQILNSDIVSMLIEIFLRIFRSSSQIQFYSIFQAYVGDTVEDKPHKRNSVRLAIRKVRFKKKLD